MQKRKKVGAIDTTTMLLLLAGGAAVLYFVMQKPAPVTVVKQTLPSNTSSSGLTAAEIAAGATVADTLINDLSGDNS